MRTPRKLSLLLGTISLILCTTSLFLGARLAWAVQPQWTPAELTRMATHVVTGEVREVYSVEKTVNDGVRKNGVDIDSVVELMVDTVEKGEGLPRRGDLVYLRATQVKVQSSEPCAGGMGCTRIPAAKDKVRVYVRSAAGGAYDVVTPNGFEVLK